MVQKTRKRDNGPMSRGRLSGRKYCRIIIVDVHLGCGRTSADEVQMYVGTCGWCPGGRDRWCVSELFTRATTTEYTGQTLKAYRRSTEQTSYMGIYVSTGNSAELTTL